MAFAPITELDHQRLLGRFTEVDCKHHFEYGLSPDGESPWPDYPLVVWLGHEYRYVKMVKTRAYVVVDEGPNGEPIIETWKIRNHNRYNLERKIM